MAKIKYGWCWGFVLCLAATSHQLAKAQELDSAVQFYRYTGVLLGQPSLTTAQYAQYDINDLLPALNDGLRRVASDVGITAFDTLTIADNTYSYALNADFMQSQDGQKPVVHYAALRVSKDGKTITGLKQTPLEEFSTLSGGTSPQVMSPEAIGFSVTGRTLWLYPAGFSGDKVYVTGPCEAIRFVSDTSTIINVYKQDRPAVCYWAASQLAMSRGDATRAQDLLQRYIQHVIARTGRAPVPQAGG